MNRPGRIGQQAADLALREGQHGRLAAGFARQFVTFGLYAARRGFLPEQDGEVCGVDADEFGQPLFEQEAEGGRGNLCQKRCGGFQEARFAFLRRQVEAV